MATDTNIDLTKLEKERVTKPGAVLEVVQITIPRNVQEAIARNLQQAKERSGQDRKKNT